MCFLLCSTRKLNVGIYNIYGIYNTNFTQNVYNNTYLDEKKKRTIYRSLVIKQFFNNFIISVL